MKTLTVKIDTKHWVEEFPEESGLELTPSLTSRGFSHYEFQDCYKQRCSLQESSLATESAIWLGVDSTGPVLTGPSGEKDEEVGARMHLTRKQIEQLLPILHMFVETGSLGRYDEKQIL